MACLARRTDDTLTQKFGDWRHNFFIELRCNRKPLPSRDVCELCILRSADNKNQFSRRFDHGLVSEPISENSHIFGGKWYMEKCQKWGAPSEEVIKFALMYQREARDGFDVKDVSYKEEEQCTYKPVKMPPRKRKTTEEFNAELTAATDALATLGVKPLAKRKARII